VSAIKPAKAGNTQAIQSPAVVPTSPRTSVALSLAAGHGRGCMSHAVLVVPSSHAMTISVPSSNNGAGTRSACHEISRGATRKRRAQTTRQPPKRRGVTRKRAPKSEPSTQALTMQAGTSADRLTDQALGEQEHLQDRDSQGCTKPAPCEDATSNDRIDRALGNVCFLHDRFLLML
jgi:hypothetical protein